jgi:hypothetical protein
MKQARRQPHAVGQGRTSIWVQPHFQLLDRTRDHEARTDPAPPRGEQRARLVPLTATAIEPEGRSGDGPQLGLRAS